ncbi:hypothetical protein F53441_8076 [Fusarium austroafricanum]|uniref:Uncharacterized protein n=1 Tax=Fusarium austroafricanum TaxID=2364996 RepID=A0A8H4KE18_9HYPO|nr:hypothetical protein F53441_8076 [Fusarium austroafricanum]
MADSAHQTTSEAESNAEHQVSTECIIKGLEQYELLAWCLWKHGGGGTRVAFARRFPPPAPSHEEAFAVWGEIASLVYRIFKWITPFTTNRPVNLGMAFFVFLESMKDSFEQQLARPFDWGFDDLWMEMQAKWAEISNETRCLEHVYI